MNGVNFATALVRRTLQLTGTLMDDDSIPWESAKLGVQRVMGELIAEFPQYATEIRIEVVIWIDQQNEKRGLQPSEELTDPLHSNRG